MHLADGTATTRLLVLAALTLSALSAFSVVSLADPTVSLEAAVTDSLTESGAPAKELRLGDLAFDRTRISDLRRLAPECFHASKSVKPAGPGSLEDDDLTVPRLITYDIPAYGSVSVTAVTENAAACFGPDVKDVTLRFRQNRLSRAWIVCGEKGCPASKLDELLKLTGAAPDGPGRWKSSDFLITADASARAGITRNITIESLAPARRARGYLEQHGWPAFMGFRLGKTTISELRTFMAEHGFREDEGSASWSAAAPADLFGLHVFGGERTGVTLFFTKTGVLTAVQMSPLEGQRLPAVESVERVLEDRGFRFLCLSDTMIPVTLPGGPARFSSRIWEHPQWSAEAAGGMTLMKIDLLTVEGSERVWAVKVSNPFAYDD
ncbi:hypothetical protein [Sutterella sp.]|uniref:hypothetical protein n=1 Tax=Sutterella sp. TaxID=1981025 RepID=UPI0026E06E08|nr:hypothetical protein [Sutterella sp.]MDO5532725.1 hypothetical protein [Sutterella sp.]